MTPGRDDEPPSDDAASRRARSSRRALGAVLAVLAVSSLLLAARGQLPAAPVFVLVIVAIGAGLWWLADRGGRYRDRPVAGPLEALMLVAATLASIVAFWILWDVLG